MRIFRFFSTLEKIILLSLIIVIGGTGYYLYGRYIRDHSDLVPGRGGIFTEGLIGHPQFLNPLLITGNGADRDITHLIFSGLTRYNPHTRLIEDDIATSQRSNDNLTYTFTIVPDAVWHDNVPVTADDVIFTYKTVLQSPEFPNGALKQAFRDVTIVKTDERTVEFRLLAPYSFFLANVTLGLLPSHILQLVPVKNLDKSEFNQAPIGTGPYQFVNWTNNNDIHEITLRRYDAYYGPLPKVQTLVFRAFPDEDTLILSENTLSGFRIPSGSDPQDFLGDSLRFDFLSYRLPQYSALFLNTDSEILANKKVRFALLLATDKDEVLDAVGDADIVDTPILESKADLDIEFSLERSMGAFFDTEWNLPEKVKARLEEKDTSKNKNKENESTGGPLDSSSIQEAQELKFILTATQDTWISLSLDGVAQASFLLKSGDEKVFTVSKALTFRTIGNAAGLSIVVNGLALKSMGDQGVVLRNIVLDRLTLPEYLDEVSEMTLQDSEEINSEDSSDSEKTIQVSDEEEVSGTENSGSQPDDILDSDTIDELDKVRINDAGDRLILRLVTAQEPSVFLEVAEIIQRQWLEAGAKLIIETYSLPDLQEKIKNRDYDILLFGQNLGYNLDAFPFWHSSQSGDGLNLSDYRSLEADNLLVSIRKTFDERTKQEFLDKLKKTIAEDTPAIFLYNPYHFYAIRKSVRNVELGSLSNHADRFTDLLNWYVREDYELRKPFSFSQLFNWIFSF